MAATGISSVKSTGGFSARLMLGKGANNIPGSLGPRSPKKLHSMGKTLEAEMQSEDSANSPPHLKPASNEASPPPSKTSNCKDTHSLWKSVQDCHASLAVENPRHFEFAVANLCFLLKAYGRELDNYVKFDIDRIFQTIRCLALDPSKRPTTRMQLLKVIELRARRWDTEQKNYSESNKTKEKAKDGMASNRDSKEPKSQSTIAAKDVNQQPRSEKDVTKTLNKMCIRHPPGLLRTNLHELPQDSSDGTGGDKLRTGTQAASELDAQHTDKPPSNPKSTGFWDALTTVPEFSPRLPTIPEEKLSDGLVRQSILAFDKAREGARAPSSTVQSQSLLSPTERSNRSAVPPATDELPVFRESPTPPLKRSSSPTFGSGFRTRRFSTGSVGSCIQPQQYSREFLLKCWDSPLCKEMPAALQHTIPHSDIYYIIRIPTFEDPSFLLSDTTPPNIVSTVRCPDRNQSLRKRHMSWPNATKSVEEPYGKSSLV